MFGHIIRPISLCIKFKIHKMFVRTEYVFDDDDDNCKRRAGDYR